ncbi:HlyD family secretion protein [Dysgonomonas alginatilytica]|uniref:HlyD family secretion protein n=1 Tax=Dysgonomonas alginatilytica TaxID=1605892 RepID=A0A2V3PTS5_9BACT|nr:HlyD family efflux transporter periplasmic adaptor subunit [Dysgonomonas alginatilytica]PXV68999.1 HlyD family secretion protein [Dysgonomonas alginatilytica]
MQEKEIEKEIELRSEEFQEVLGSVPSWILRRGITVVAVIVLIILVGSAVFKYPDTVVTTMVLTGTTPQAPIVAKTSGKLKELNITDEQIVKTGDYLAVIENPAKTQDILKLKDYLFHLNVNIDSAIISIPPKDLNLGSMQSLYSSFYITSFEYHEFKRLNYYIQKIDFMRERIAQYQEYYKQLLHQKNIVDEQMKLGRSQYSRDSILNKRGVISQEDLEATKNKYLQGYLSLENMNGTLQNTQIEIARMQESLLDTEYQYIDKKNTLEAQLKTYMAQLLTEIQVWEQNYVFVTPIDGKVTFTNYWTENQNVVAGENVFNVIPDKSGKLIGKASMAMTRSGKVKPGQSVNIRFPSFPDNEFGMVKGFVRSISTIPSQNAEDKNNYVVEIDLPDGLKTTYKKELPYLPEMEAQADIITEDMSLLERFFMPLRKIWKEGME